MQLLSTNFEMNTEYCSPDRSCIWPEIGELLPLERGAISPSCRARGWRQSFLENGQSSTRGGHRRSRRRAPRPLKLGHENHWKYQIISFSCRCMQSLIILGCSALPRYTEVMTNETLDILFTETCQQPLALRRTTTRRSLLSSIHLYSTRNRNPEHTKHLKRERTRHLHGTHAPISLSSPLVTYRYKGGSPDLRISLDTGYGFVKV